MFFLITEAHFISVYLKKANVFKNKNYLFDYFLLNTCVM